MRTPVLASEWPRVWLGCPICVRGIRIPACQAPGTPRKDGKCRGTVESRPWGLARTVLHGSAAHPSRPPVTLSREATEAEESDASAAVAQDGGARPGPGRCASGLERKEAPGAHASRAAPPQPATAVGDLHAAPRPAPGSAGGARAPGAPGAVPRARRG